MKHDCINPASLGNLRAEKPTDKVVVELSNNFRTVLGSIEKVLFRENRMSIWPFAEILGFHLENFQKATNYAHFSLKVS